MTPPLPAGRRKLISIVILAYNEEASLPGAIQRIDAVIAPLSGRYDFEILILDNASPDRTGEIARQQCARDRRWKYLLYSRNFGAEASMLAGLDHARGDAVINVFADLQDPPEEIPCMLAKWESGAQVVHGVVLERSDSNWLKTLGARVAYALIRFFTDTHIPPNATDFRLLDRKVVNVLCQMREPDRYLRGLVHWVGFRRDSFVYDRAPRRAGRSQGTLLFCIGYALRAIVAFSSRPLQFAMLFGLAVSLGSLLLGAIYLVLYFHRPAFLAAAPPGLTTLLLLALFALGLNSLFLGIIGEYIGRIYNQGKQRPLYLVAESVNLD